MAKNKIINPQNSESTETETATNEDAQKMVDTGEAEIPTEAVVTEGEAAQSNEQPPTEDPLVPANQAPIIEPPTEEAKSPEVQEYLSKVEVPVLMKDRFQAMERARIKALEGVTVELEFEQDAIFDGVLYYEKGIHQVPVIRNVHSFWIARGAKEVKK